MVYLFLSYLFTAAWQDFRKQSISIRVYLLFGIIALIVRTVFFLSGGAGLFGYVLQCICSMSIGIFLLAVSWFSDGKVGEGDGWFFIVSGLYLSFWENLYLLAAGLFFCSLWGLGLMAEARWKRNITAIWKKKTLPFLPFLIPAMAWMLFL